MVLIMMTFPLIVKQPVEVNLKKLVKQQRFVYVAIGNAPISLSMVRNNNPISGATSSSYTTSPVNLRK